MEVLLPEQRARARWWQMIGRGDPPWGMARRKGEGASAMVVWELLFFSADGKKNKKRFPPALLPVFLFVSLSSGQVDKERVEARVCEWEAVADIIHKTCRRSASWRSVSVEDSEWRGWRLRCRGCSLCVIQWSHPAVRSNVPNTASVFALSHYTMFCTRWNITQTNEIHFICLRPKELNVWVKAKHRRWKMTGLTFFLFKRIQDSFYVFSLCWLSLF